MIAPNHAVIHENSRTWRHTLRRQSSRALGLGARPLDRVTLNIDFDLDHMDHEGNAYKSQPRHEEMVCELKRTVESHFCIGDSTDGLS